VGNPTPVKINTFSAGELSKRMLSRPDLPIYRRGLRTCENFLPFSQGGLQTRPGTRYIAGVIDSTVQSRLIPFKIGTTTAYVVEFGAQKYRVYLNNNGTYEVDSDFESEAPWNVPFAQYANKVFNPSAQTTSNNRFRMKPDGTKLYVIDSVANIVYQYSLSTADDITTATYDSKSFNFNSKESQLRDIYFKPDGLAVFITGTATNKVFKYTLGTAWDISTAVDASQEFDISGKTATVRSLVFSSDGAEMYTVGNTNDNVDQWTLATPWDVSTASTTYTKDISGQDGEPNGLYFKSDGTIMYLGGNANDTVYQYPLSTAWDLSTAVFKAQLYVPTQVNNVGGVSLNSDGLIMHVCDVGNGKIYQYNLLAETVFTESQLQDIQYAQSNDVLYLAHPSHPPQKLQRGPDNEWSLSDVNFRPPPTKEIKEASSTTLTLSAITGTGITVTAGAATFLGTPDIGKIITAGTGRLIITAYTSPTVVTADVLDDFEIGFFAAGDWYIIGSPTTGLTPGGTGLNTTITLTADAASFRDGSDSLPTDIGKYIHVRGGTCKITAFTSSTVVSATVLSELDSTTKTYDWTMEQAIWNATDGYPSTVVFHQDRLIWGGSTGFPQTIAASVVGDYENHARGANASDAMLLTLNAREVNQIEWLVSRKGLIAGTTEAEWLIQANAGILTPTDRFADLETEYGSKSLRPTIIDGSVLFYQTLGRKLRELTFNFGTDGYTAPDISEDSEHITDGGINEVSYQKSPMSILWQVRNDGQLVGLTFVKGNERKEPMIAWHRHILGGAFSGGDAVVESVASIPHPTDDYDELWMVVKRTIDSATVRYIEVLTKVKDSTTLTDYWQVDSGKTFTSGAATSTITGMSHLEGQTVTVVNTVTGASLGTFTVSGGEVDLGTEEVTTALVGLAFTADMKPVKLVQDFKHTLTEVYMEFLNTRGGKLGPSSTDTDSIDYQNDAGTFFSGTIKQNIKSQIDRDGSMHIIQDDPYPMTILSIAPVVDANRA
jgi:hypothetical protein